MNRLEQFRQRISIHYHLQALNFEETRQYILHRINHAKVNGRDMNSLFESSTFELIYQFSGGLPRLINKLCDHTLFVGFVGDKSSISTSVIDEAISELRFREERKSEQIFQGA